MESHSNLRKGSLNGKRILGADSYDLLWRPYVPIEESDPPQFAGLGWFLSTYKGKRLLSHGGSDTGFETTLDQLFQEEHLTIPLRNNSLLDLSRWLHEQRSHMDRTRAGRLTTKVTKLVTRHLLDRHAEATGERLIRGTVDYREETLLRAIESITRFFTSNIRYLGPLRTDPGMTQLQFAPSGELDDVGVKGEYAAFVYHTNQNTRIDFYHPETLRLEQASLGEALDVWARYLGVAEAVRTDLVGTTGMIW